MEDFFKEMMKNRPAGQQMPGMGPQDPAVMAQKLKDSLEAIKLSADYLKNAKYVK
jgi:hypothetical protein